jgi:small subunit ribosomal protein S6
MATKKREITRVEDNRLNEYELVVIMSPDVAEESLENAISGISQSITDKGGTISSVDNWGKRRLAYPLQHHLEGTYLLARFTLSPARCKEIEANLKISEQVLRHLLIKQSS